MSIPNLVLLLGLAAITEVWIRMTGLLTAILGGYFLYSARYDDRTFYCATVYARLAFLSGVTLFAILGLAVPVGSA